MKHITLVVMLVMVAAYGTVHAQDKQAFLNQRKQAKERFADSIRDEREAYRHRINEEYAQFMRQRWEAFQSMKGTPAPTLPDPPKPFQRDEITPLPELPVSYNRIITAPIQEERPVELVTMPEPTTFTSVPAMPSIHIEEVSESFIADTWQLLTYAIKDTLLQYCISQRDKLTLGDWPYYCLLRDLTEKQFGKDTNEAILMQAFLLMQTGYKARISRRNNHLALLLPFDSPVYEKTYLLLDGERYYDFGKESDGMYHVFNQALTNQAHVLSLRMNCPPKTELEPSEKRTFTCKKFPELSVTLSVNKKLMAFYEEYPKCLWTNYSWAGLSEEVKTELYPVLKAGIKGKNQIEAANRLINFVQTAFDYQTDREQFGYERPLFADETFYYPYSDCEDRSILFSILVRDLLGLDVVLLRYPDHLATAVHFTETLKGTSLSIDGKAYYLCDPTYIGANVGECMPKYAKTSPEIYQL